MPNLMKLIAMFKTSRVRNPPPVTVLSATPLFLKLLKKALSIPSPSKG